MSNRQTTPEIRFKSYYNNWNNKILREMVSTYSGGTPRVGNKEYYDGTIPFIRSAEINSKSTELFISEVGLENSSAKMISKGDILYALYGATSGEVGISQITGAINQAVLAICPKNNYNKQFLVYWLKYNKERILAKYLQGGQGNLSGSIVKNIILEIPRDKSEQQKIGNLFEKLDKVISLQQQVLDATKEYKQSMLQKMLPKKGEKVPEIRFSNFVDDWKSTKMSKIVKSGSKKRVEDTSLYRRLTVKLNKKGLEEYVPERQLADTRPFYQRFVGEIIIGKQNYFNGSVAIVPKEYDGFICSNAIMSFSVPNDNINFIYNLISQNNFIRLRSHLANGTGQKELSEKDFLNFNLMIPTVEEQEKIGSFFKTLDEKIEKEEQKLEAYKDMKKALMQRMFV